MGRCPTGERTGIGTGCCLAFAETTSSLPCTSSGNRSQPAATVLGYFRGFEAGRFAAGCHPLQPRGSIKAPSSVVVAGHMAGTALLVTSRCLLRRPVVWVPSRSVRVAMRLQRAIEAQSAGRHAQLDACNLCEEGRARCRRSDSRRRRPSRTTTGRRPTSPARKSRRRLLAGLDKCGEPCEG